MERGSLGPASAELPEKPVKKLCISFASVFSWVIKNKDIRVFKILGGKK